MSPTAKRMRWCEGCWLASSKQGKVGSWARDPEGAMWWKDHTVTHSVNLINDILYIIRATLSCGLMLGRVQEEEAILLTGNKTRDIMCQIVLRSFCALVYVFCNI